MKGEDEIRRDPDKAPPFRPKARREARPKARPTRANGNGHGHAGEGTAPDWRSLLLVTKGEIPLGCEANVALALRHASELTGRVRFNELTVAAEGADLPWRQGEDWRAWADIDDTALAVWCQHAGMKVKPATCSAAVQLVAADRPHHPVRAYLDGLEWDGKERLDGWLHDHLGVEVDEPEKGATDEERAAIAAKNAYVRAVGRKWMISAVARAYLPGCKADHALILQGRQRALKSSALSALVPDLAWFADEIADLGSKDSAQDLAGKWIIEIAELSAMRRPDIERVKSFISRAIDHYRPSYGRRSGDFPRDCVFGGTTNADEFLADETGNRRFWCVRVGKIDLDGLRRDRDQLWAEAVAAFRAEETWWLDEATEKAAAVEQDERRIADPWEERLLERVAGLAEVSVDTALAAVGVPLERYNQPDANRVARILRAAGWKHRQGRRDGGRPRFYERPPVTGKDEASRVAEGSTRDGETGAKPSNSAGFGEGVTGVTGVTGNFNKRGKKGEDVGDSDRSKGNGRDSRDSRDSRDTRDTRDSRVDAGFSVTGRPAATRDTPPPARATRDSRTGPSSEDTHPPPSSASQAIGDAGVDSVVCRYCRGTIDPRRPGWLAFDDRTVAHDPCHAAAHDAGPRP